MEAVTNSGSNSETVDISTERTLGLIGSVLGLASIVRTSVSGLLALIGAVLILVALYGIGNKLEDERPFNYYLKAIIVIFVLIMVGVIVIAAALIVSSGSTSSMENEFIMSPGSDITIIEEESPHLTGEGIVLLVIGAGIIIAGLIAGGYFQKKAWEAMYELTGVEAFQNAAKFLWWGVLTIIILIGAILLLISAIFQIIAFANLPKRLSKRSTPPAPTPVEELSW